MPLKEKMEKLRDSCVLLEQVPTWQEYAEKEKPSVKPPAEPKADADEELNSKVSFYEGDITDLAVDAIVNAANTHLYSGSGVCGAIFKRAAGALEEECDSLKGCDTGKAKLTGGYQLPAKYILHAVGPTDKNRKDLISCYINCLKYLRQSDDENAPNIRSIAFPCIATGIYGFPHDSAAEIAVRTARKYLEKHRDQVDRIIFCVFDKVKDKPHYMRYLMEHFPLKTSTESTESSDSN